MNNPRKFKIQNSEFKIKRKGAVFLLLVFLCTAFTGTEVTISGKVFSNDPNIAKCILIVKVVAKKGSKTLAVGHDLLDTTGVYSLTFTAAPTVEHPVDVFVSGLYVDTMYLRSYSSFSSDNIPLDIEIPIKYTKDASGNVICPKCHSSANILPVTYGTKRHFRRIIKNCDTTVVQVDHVIANPMHTDLRPYWYCTKCNIQF